MDDHLAPPPPAASPLLGTALAMGLSLLVAWTLALVDGLLLVAGTPIARAPVLGVLVGVWTPMVLFTGLMGWGLTTYQTRNPLASRDTHPSQPLRPALTTVVVLLAGLMLHRVLVALEHRSTDTLFLVTVTLLLLGTPITLALHRWVESARARFLRTANVTRPRLVSVSLVITAAVALAYSLWRQHGDFFLELTAHEPWLDAVTLLPVALGLLAARRSSRLGWVSLQRRMAHPRRLLLLSLALTLLGLLMGVLGAQALQPEAARVLRDRTLYSGTLVRAGLRMGVPAPAFETAGGVRACIPGDSLSVPGSLGSAASDAPDILLITIDGLRFDHTSLAPDSQHPNTPHLLELSSQAAVFSRAYTPAPSTRAAFRSMFTGLHPGQMDAPNAPGLPWAMTLLPGQPTLAAYLNEAGYRTLALVSKPKAFPASTGALAGFAEVDDTPTPYQTRYRHSAQLKVSRIIGHLAAPPSDDRSPRFVWTHFIEPHYPYTRGSTLDTSPAGRSQEARHDQAVQFIDEQLERLLRFALAPERRDRTIVIVTSDHGEAFDEHHNSRHGATVFEEEIHVPLLVFGPNIAAGTRTTPVSLVDLLPTVLALAGLDAPSGVCGEGWVSSLRSGSEPAAQPLYVAALPDGTTRYHQLAFLMGDEKLIVDGGTGQQQRFQLARDPLEQHPDLDSAHVASLRRELDVFLRERGLPSPP